MKAIVKILWPWSYRRTCVVPNWRAMSHWSPWKGSKVGYKLDMYFVIWLAQLRNRIWKRSRMALKWYFEGSVVFNMEAIPLHGPMKGKMVEQIFEFRYLALCSVFWTALPSTSRTLLVLPLGAFVTLLRIDLVAIMVVNRWKNLSRPCFCRFCLGLLKRGSIPRSKSL